MDSLATRLYFGTIENTFNAVNGDVFSVKDHSLLQEYTPENEKIASSRSEPLSSLGEDYANVVVPAIPTVDVIYKRTNDGKTASNIPETMLKPLLKAKDGKIVGLQSGRRSAVLYANGKWYRLKGCGDLYNAFPIRNLEHPKYSHFVEVRGCMFEHTCLGELYITSLVSSVLDKHNMPSANKSVGWWVYDLPEQPKPKVKRYCALYETLGDKRLGEHLLVGMERLLPLLFGADFDASSVLAAFPGARKDPSDPESVFPTSIVGLVGDGSFGEYIDVHKVPCPCNTVDPKLPSNVDSKWVEKWGECATTLKTEQDMRSLLASLYWMIGRECGNIHRIMVENGISWGTYEDALGFHCNAHPNNYVVLPNFENGHFLAPLDFDMAYTFDNFVKQKDGVRDEAILKEWKNLERNALGMALAGDDQVNSGATGKAVLSKSLEVLKCALRDTLMLGFESATSNKVDLHPLKEGHKKALRALIDMSLMLTASDIA